MLVLALVSGGVFAAWKAIATWRSDFDLAAAQALQLQPNASTTAVSRELRRALAARPDLAGGWRMLAQNDSFDSPSSARVAAQRATELDPADWRNWQSLALIDFQLGNIARAQADFAAAARLESGFAAHYERGNFDRLLGDQAAFWQEMGQALEMVPTRDADATLRTLLADDPSSGHGDFLGHLPRDRPDVVAMAVSLLVQNRLLSAAWSAWSMLQCQIEGPNALALAPDFDADWAPSCAGLTYGFANALEQAAWQAPSATSRAAALSPSAPTAAPAELTDLALRVWNRAAHSGWIPAAPVRSGQVSDPDFNPPWQGPAFGWSVASGSSLDAVYVNSGGGPDALHLRFDGQEPDQLELASQWVPVAAGRQYRVRFASRRFSGAQSGIRLMVRDPERNLLEIPADLEPFWASNSGMFTAGPRDALVQLVFSYARPIGQVRLQGEVALRDVNLHASGAQEQR